MCRMCRLIRAGLDSDAGQALDLTKKFLDLTPGAYPAFSMLTAHGAAALTLDLGSGGRVLPFLYPLDSNHAMNVRPLNHSWEGHAMTRRRIWPDHALAGARVHRRFMANRGLAIKAINLVLRHPVEARRSSPLLWRACAPIACSSSSVARAQPAGEFIAARSNAPGTAYGALPPGAP